MSIPILLGLALQVGSANPAIVERARVDPRKAVSFHALAFPETVYVGQAFTYELGVFIADEIRQRLRKNPEFVPPDLRSVLAYELREPRGARIVVREGRTYEVHVFRRALFPVAPGRIDIPPAKLSYALPLGSSFFSREETHLLTSEPVHVVAIAPPAVGRPVDWNGAVGNLRVTTRSSGASARVGDPIVVTVRVSGEGNVNLLPRPTLEIAWASVVPGAERVMIDSLATNVRGTKEFEWLVIPTGEGNSVIPSVRYPYFDPSDREYRLASSSPHQVLVLAGGLASIDTVSSIAPVTGSLPLRTTWTREMPDAPDHALWYWIVCGVIPVPALVRMWQRRPRTRRAGTPDSVLHELADGRTADVARVRAVLRAALDARLGGTPIPWSDAPALRRNLRHHGITDQTIAQAMVLLSRIDDAAYGRGHEPIPDAAARASAIYDAIDREARGTQRARVARRAGAAVLVFFAATLAAQAGLSPRAFFERGVTSYAEGSAMPAAADFIRAAREVPGVASAWANAGTASWVAGDTAMAVVGWQRALRLNPLDEDARQRLLLVGADAGAGRDVVWPIPRRAPGWIALALWIAGWALLWRNWRRRVAAGIVASALVIAGVSQAHHRRLTATNLAVMARPAPLRTLPAMGSEAGATPLTGELVHVRERNGVWVRIAAGGGREGWIDGARVLDLDGRPWRD